MTHERKKASVWIIIVDPTARADNLRDALNFDGWGRSMPWKKILLAIVGVLVLGAAGAFMFRDGIAAYVVERGVAPYLGDKPAYTHKRGRTLRYRVAMKDGIELNTKAYLPRGEGPWPTVLVRDPYGFNNFLFCHALVRYGYACVHQDVRGRFDSDGEWYPFVNEAEDGEATLNWLVDQDWQDGNIATIGFSYLAISQWAVADRLPPEVKTILPMLGHGDVYDIVYRGGHFTQGLIGFWSTGLFKSLGEQGDVGELWRTQVAATRPALDVDPEIFGDAWPGYRDYISHPLRADPYWESASYKQMRSAHRRVNVPVFWVAGWHDFFLQGTLERFDEMPTADESVLFIQPGEHGGATADLAVEDHTYQFFSASLDWLDHHLRDRPLPDYLAPGVVYYRNGADQWSRAPAWPPSSDVLQLDLAQLDAAAACGGALVEGGADAGEPAAVYRYDPEDPAPTTGGAFMLSGEVAPPATSLQGLAACERADTLSFLSEPFESETRIAGGVDVSLRVSSDAPDTAFFVRISEVFEDGRILNIRDDILSLSARDGDHKATEYAPEEVVDLEFPLTPIDWTLAPGSQIRLDITSSNAPAFAAHYNRAGLWSEHASPAIAEQSVYAGSSVTLPLAVRRP